MKICGSERDRNQWPSRYCGGSGAGSDTLSGSQHPAPHTKPWPGTHKGRGREAGLATVGGETLKQSWNSRGPTGPKWQQQLRTECDGGGSLMAYAPLGAIGISNGLLPVSLANDEIVPPLLTRFTGLWWNSTSTSNWVYWPMMKLYFHYWPMIKYYFTHWQMIKYYLSHFTISSPLLSQPWCTAGNSESTIHTWFSILQHIPLLCVFVALSTKSAGVKLKC